MTPSPAIPPVPDPRHGAWAADGGIYLGAGGGGWAWSGAERSALVLGPSRSGKTSCLVIPNVLAAAGPVVVTSTKPDVLAATASARARRGDAFLYDPSGAIDPPAGVRRLGWSPVRASRTWDGSLLMADGVVRSAPGTGREVASTGEDHWTERATALLAPMLHAAALDGASMAAVVAWIDRHDGSVALRTLAERRGEDHPATHLLAGILTTDAREQSGIWSTASGAVAAYRSTAALASTEPPLFDASTFCAGANTLYVCATGRWQRLLAPLVVGLLSDVRDAAYARAQAGQTSPPVLLALDELANIAPIPDLAALVSEGPGQGLLTLACLQDLSQARARWGREAQAFLSLFGTTVVLPGIADVATLETISALAGRTEVATRTVGTSLAPGGALHRSATTSTERRERLAVDEIARGRPGAAVAVDARNRVGWVQLTPAHATPPWRDLLGPARELLAGARDRGPFDVDRGR